MSAETVLKTREELLGSLRRIRERIKQREALQQGDREAEADLLAVLRSLSSTGPDQ